MNRRQGWTAVLLSLLAGCMQTAFTPDPPTGQKITLRLNPERGKIYSYKYTTQAATLTARSGPEDEARQAVSRHIDMQVTGADARGGVTVRVTYTRVQIKVSSPTSLIESDSAVANREPRTFADALCRALVGPTFTVRFADNGSVTGAGGVEELRKSIVANVRDARPSLLSLYSDLGMRETWQAREMVLPGRPVDNGDTWTHRRELTDAYPVILEHTWTLLRHDGDTATCCVKTTVRPNPRARPGRSRDGSILRRSVSGTQSGTAVVDRKTGMVRQMRITKQIVGDITPDEEGKKGKGLRIEQRGSITFTLIGVRTGALPGPGSAPGGAPGPPPRKP